MPSCNKIRIKEEDYSGRQLLSVFAIDTREREKGLRKEEAYENVNKEIKQKH